MKYFLIALLLFVGCSQQVQEPRNKISREMWEKFYELCKLHIQHGQYDEARVLEHKLLNYYQIIEELRP